MSKIYKIIPFVLLISFTAIFMFKILSKEDKSEKFNELSLSSEGKNIPDDIVPLLIDAGNEKDLSFKDYKGKFTVVNLFASWCIACVAEHGVFTKIKDKYGDEVQIVGVNWRDKKDDAINWLEKYGNPYNKVAYDNFGKYGISLGIRGIPETFLVDKDGVILKHFRGNIDISITNYIDELK